MNDNMLYAYLVNELGRRENRLIEIERAFWWRDYDVFGTFEVLEAKIQYETFREISHDLHKLLRLFGDPPGNSTK